MSYSLSKSDAHSLLHILFQFVIHQTVGDGGEEEKVGYQYVWDLGEIFGLRGTQDEEISGLVA